MLKNNAITIGRFLTCHSCENGNTATDRGFTGHKHNDELGLIYMNARYYLPAIGRFLTRHSRENGNTLIPDPQNPQSFNRYSYVNNQPLNLVDPSGHFGVCFQQGNADQNDNAGLNNTALRQMCAELAEQGYFGTSGSFEVFGNDTKGLQSAVAWLREQMSLHPDDPIFLMGYSWGGGGALDFANLLNEQGGDYLTLKDQWNGNKVPENIVIDGLILIDPVISLRGWQTKYSEDHDVVPSNVKYAINLYATVDAYGGTIFDAGIQNIEGALNVGMVGTNHCSIAYSNCAPRVPAQVTDYLGPKFSFPQYDNMTGPVNRQILNLMKLFLSPMDIMY